jgi:hypothetical protein
MATGKGLGRLSKQKSVMNIEANPLESGNLQTTAMKVENLSDCISIAPAELSALISRLSALEANDERLRVLEEAKLPYLFASEQLLKMLEITTSIKTKIQMIAQIGPRLSDPRAKTQQFLDLFRYSEEKNQVEEILKARNQAILSSQFSTASSGAGRGGAGRGSLLGGRGGGRGGAGRGSGLGVRAADPNNRPLPSLPTDASVSPELTTDSGSKKAMEKTPVKHLEIATHDSTPLSQPPFSPSSTVSTPCNEPVVTDINDVFSFLDAHAGPPSARTSRRLTMDTIAERSDYLDDDDSDDDEDSKPSQLAADDTSLTTAETAPSVSTLASSPYVRSSQISTTGSIAHNLSDGSLTEVDSKAADAAVALIAAIVAKEAVNDMEKVKVGSPVVRTAEQNKFTTPEQIGKEPAKEPTVHDHGPLEGLEVPVSSRPDSFRLDEKDTYLTSPGLIAALDLTARPRAMSNPAADGCASPRAPGSTTVSLGVDRTTLLRQSLHHSSFHVGPVPSRDEELQAVALASSQMRQVAAKIFSGGDRDSAIAAITAPTSVRPTTLQRAQSEIISKELSRSTGSIAFQASSINTSSNGMNVKSPMCSASDDVALRYAIKAMMTKDEFLALTSTEPLSVNEAGEPQFCYRELLRRNFRKDYGELKQAELQRYLTNDEFLVVFQKNKADFELQAKWRQVDQKKKALLF